jgi:Penicillin binding protein transpeptidase domain
MRLSPKTVELIKQGLWGVVNSPIGTAYSQRLPGMDFVGKTGSVQVIRIAAEKIYQRCENLKYQDRHNAMFVGFAPAKDPVIAVSVVGEHTCHGATGAAPIAGAIVKRYLEKYFPDIYGEKILAARLKAQGQSIKVSRSTQGAPVDEEAFNPNEDLQVKKEVPSPTLPPPISITPSEATLPKETDVDSSD